MKVKELIEELKKFNPEAEAKVFVGGPLKEIYFSWVSPDSYSEPIEMTKATATEVVIEAGEAKPEPVNSSDGPVDVCCDDACDSDLASEYAKPASSKEFSEDNYLKS